MTVNGITYTATGIYTDTARYSLSGCDSIVYAIDLQIDSFSIVSIDTTICQGESLTVNGTTYTATGVYNDTAQHAASNCDSIQYVIDLQIDSLIITSIDTTICQGQSLTVNGITYTSSGQYNDTVRFSASNCDSIQYVINLAIDSFIIENIDTTICQGQNLTVNGITYSVAGLYNDTARYTVSSCDSIQYVINLAIDSFIVSNIDTTICQGQTLTVNGVTYTASGFYNDTASYTISGCDSIQYVIDLQIDSLVVTNIDTTICQGQTLTVNGMTYTSSGLYNDTARYTASNCDSIQYVINLAIDSFIVTNIDTTICQGQTLTVNGVTYTSSGLYNDTARYTASNCDSIQYVINLAIDSFIVTSIDTTICQGQSLTVNGVTYTATGIYNDTASFVASGCDSIQYVIDLQIDSFIVENTDTTICQGESIVVNGVNYNATGNFNDTLRFASGCDSVLFVINLAVTPLPTVQANSSELDSAACINENVTLFGTGTAGVNYTWNNGVTNNTNFNLPLGSTTYVLSGEDALGCISLDTISMQGNPTFNNTVNVAICEDEMYTLPDGTLVNTPGVYTVNLNSIGGCDSIITTTIDVNLLGIFVPLEDIIVCDGLSQIIEIESQNISIYEWFVNDGSGSQSLVGNPLYMNANGAALSFNLDTSLHQNVYTVVMLDECGNSYSESATLEVYSPHNVVDPFPDTTFCLHEIEAVNIDYNGSDYQWNNGTFGPSLLVETSGEYIVEFVENGTNCLLSDTLNISVEDCLGNCVVLAPTGFSPNANGINDIFRVVTTCDEGFTKFEFVIFNRWGELVYSTDNWLEGWDGTFGGQPAGIGTYSFVVQYVKTLTNKEEILSGNVTLIR